MDQGNNGSRRGRVSTVLAAAAFLTIAAAPAGAQSAASFYSGKLIRFIIPDGVGGGYDAYSRILARHLADHIPGHPASCLKTCLARTASSRPTGSTMRRRATAASWARPTTRS